MKTFTTSLFIILFNFMVSAKYDYSLMSLGNTADNRTQCLVDLEGIKCWGENLEIIKNIPQDLTNIYHLTMTSQYACVLADQGMKCWGQVPTTLLPYNSKKIDFIRAGYKGVCLIENGTPVCPQIADVYKEHMSKLSFQNLLDIDVNGNDLCFLDELGFQCLDYYGGYYEIKLPFFISKVERSFDARCFKSPEGVFCNNVAGDGVKRFFEKRKTSEVQDVALLFDHLCAAFNGSVVCDGMVDLNKNAPKNIGKVIDLKVFETHEHYGVLYACARTENDLHCWTNIDENGDFTQDSETTIDRSLYSLVHHKNKTIELESFGRFGICEVKENQQRFCYNIEVPQEKNHFEDEYVSFKVFDNDPMYTALSESYCYQDNGVNKCRGEDSFYSSVNEDSLDFFLGLAHPYNYSDLVKCAYIDGSGWSCLKDSDNDEDLRDSYRLDKSELLKSRGIFKKDYDNHYLVRGDKVLHFVTSFYGDEKRDFTEVISGIGQIEKVFVDTYGDLCIYHGTTLSCEQAQNHRPQIIYDVKKVSNNCYLKNNIVTCHSKRNGPSQITALDLDITSFYEYDRNEIIIFDSQKQYKKKTDNTLTYIMQVNLAFGEK